MSDPGIRSWEKIGSGPWRDVSQELEDDDQAAYLAEHGEPSRWEWPIILGLVLLVACGAYYACMLIAAWWVSG